MGRVSMVPNQPKRRKKKHDAEKNINKKSYKVSFSAHACYHTEKKKKKKISVLVDVLGMFGSTFTFSKCRNDNIDSSSLSCFITRTHSSTKRHNFPHVFCFFFIPFPSMSLMHRILWYLIIIWIRWMEMTYYNELSSILGSFSDLDRSSSCCSRRNPNLILIEDKQF